MTWRPFFTATVVVLGTFGFFAGVGVLCDQVENAYGVGWGFATLGAVVWAVSAVGYWVVNR